MTSCRCSSLPSISKESNFPSTHVVLLPYRRFAAHVWKGENDTEPISCPFCWMYVMRMKYLWVYCDGILIEDCTNMFFRVTTSEAWLFSRLKCSPSLSKHWLYPLCPWLLAPGSLIDRPGQFISHCDGFLCSQGRQGKRRGMQIKWSETWFTIPIVF